jgi:hypothetical protein
MKQRLALLCMATLGVTGWADNWCQWMPDSSTILGYANVKAVRGTPLIAQLINGTDNVSKFTSAIREWTTVDLDSVTDLWFGVAGKDNAMFVLQGNFNLNTIRGVLGGIEKFHLETPPNAEFMVTMPDDKKPGKFNAAAFLSPTILVFGPPALVQAFLENVSQKRAHARLADISALDKPTHLLEFVVLKFPNEDGKTPRFITENTRCLRLGIDADEAVTAQLEIQPVKLEMVAALAQFGTGLVDLIHLISPDQIPLRGLPRVILDNAKVTSTKEAVTLTSSLPLELVRPLIASKITPAAPPPQAPPQPAKP